MDVSGDAEGLKKAILELARRDGAGIIAAAEAEAENLLAAARGDADRALAEKRAEAEAAVEHMRAMMKAAVPAEAGRERAARQEELLNSIKEAAARRLSSGADRGRAAASLAAQAITCMEGSEFVVTVEAADNGPGLAPEIVRLCGRNGVAVRVQEGRLAGGGGADVRSADGRQRWDNSFGARLERAWPWLRGRLLPAEVRDESKP